LSELHPIIRPALIRFSVPACSKYAKAKLNHPEMNIFLQNNSQHLKKLEMTKEIAEHK
jgi:hypothetical protein